MAKTYFERGAIIPKPIRNRTYYNMKHYNMDLYDAFNEAVRALYHAAPKELQDAFYNNDYRAYIPSEYTDSALAEKLLSELDIAWWDCDLDGIADLISEKGYSEAKAILEAELSEQ